MRWVTYNRNGEARLGALLEGQLVDLQLAYLACCQQDGMPAGMQTHFTSMLHLLSSSPETQRAASDSIQFAAASPKAKETSPDAFPGPEDVGLLAPLPNPGKIICIGGNFPAADKLSAPEFATIFLKPATTITGPGMPIRIPEIASSVAYEVELAVVIGRRVHNLREGDVQECIAGYTLANDLGDRLLEKRTSQWTSGKMFDSFTPTGPAILTPDEIIDPGSLRMQAWVNEQQVQKGNTGEMFFNVDFLIRYLSTLTTMEPGDLILTGSPKMMDGQPAPSVALRPGDTIRIGIDCLGELINPVMEARDE